MYALALALCLGQQFDVRPAFTIRQAAMPTPTYQSVLDRVRLGEKLTVYVGVKKPDNTVGVELASIDGETAGIFDCWLHVQDGPVMRKRIAEEAKRSLPFDQRSLHLGSTGSILGTTAQRRDVIYGNSRFLGIAAEGIGIPVLTSIRGNTRACAG